MAAEGTGTANQPKPGKRPRSSISPTIVVRDGQPILAVGAAGGPQIIMGSLLAVVNTVDFGPDPARAIDAERLDQQPDKEMSLENGRVTPQAQAELIARPCPEARRRIRQAPTRPGRRHGPPDR